MTERPITTTIPIYNRTLFTNDLTPVRLGQLNKLNNVVQEMQVVNETQTQQIGSVTYSYSNKLNALYVGSAVNVTNTEFAALSGITGNILTQLDTNTTDLLDLETSTETSTAAIDASIGTIQASLLTKKDESEYSTEQAVQDLAITALVADLTLVHETLLEKKDVASYDTERSALQTQIDDIETSLTSLSGTISEKKNISEYGTERLALLTLVDGKAPTEGPTFTGIVTIPTPTQTSSDDTAASTLFLKTKSALYSMERRPHWIP
jgi:hypothetical protein